MSPIGLPGRPRRDPARSRPTRRRSSSLSAVTPCCRWTTASMPCSPPSQPPRPVPRCLQLRPAPQDPEGSNPLRVHLPLVGHGAPSIHHQSAPPNAGTKQLERFHVTWKRSSRAGRSAPSAACAAPPPAPPVNGSPRSSLAPPLPPRTSASARLSRPPGMDRKHGSYRFAEVSQIRISAKGLSFSAMTKLRTKPPRPALT